MFRARFMSGLVVLILMAMGTAQVHRLPKPQVESADGQLAPDFTLQDQSGKEFRASRQSFTADFLSRLLVTVLHDATARVRAAQKGIR